MLKEQIQELADQLGMSQAQLLDCARWVNSCPEVKSIDDLLGVELRELQDALLDILYQRTQNPLTA